MVRKAVFEEGGCELASPQGDGGWKMTDASVTSQQCEQKIFILWSVEPKMDLSHELSRGRIGMLTKCCSNKLWWIPLRQVQSLSVDMGRQG